MRTGPIVCPETPATDYQSTLRNILEGPGSPIRNLHSTEIKRGLFTEKERCAVSNYCHDVCVTLLRKYTEVLRNCIRYPAQDLKPLILFKLPALHMIYLCRELCRQEVTVSPGGYCVVRRLLCRQEVTAKLSQYNKNCFTNVKCTLVQALRLCTGCTALRGSRGIVLLFHDQRH